MSKDKELSKKEVTSELDNMLKRLESDRWFYEPDIEYEYTPFEESLKDFCDSKINKLIQIGDCEFAWECLSKIIEELYDVDDCIDESDDLFRACELLTYYIGKVMYNSEGSLRNRIYNWIFKHIQDCMYSQYAEQYLKSFLNGDGICCSDNYYTKYKDFSEMTLVNK